MTNEQFQIFAIISGLLVLTLFAVETFICLRLWRQNNETSGRPRPADAYAYPTKKLKLEKSESKENLAQLTALATIVNPLKTLNRELIGCARQTDGTLVAALHLSWPHTLYADMARVDMVTDAVARLCGNTNWPEGTVFQFRYHCGPDPGIPLRKLIAHAKQHETLLPVVNAISFDGVQIIHQQAQAGAFRTERASLWCYLPPQPEAKGRRKLLEIIQTARDTLAVAHPIPMDHKELWQAIYHGHVRRNEHDPFAQIDPPYISPGQAIGAFFETETFELDPFEEQIVWCAQQPIAVVTLTTPPQPALLAGMLGRTLLANPDLNFHHQTVVSLRVLAAETGRRMLDRRIAQMERALTGLKRKSDSPEARRALEDARACREATIGGIDPLLEAEVAVIVFGPIVSTDASNNDRAVARKQTLDRAAAIVAALRRLGGAEATILRKYTLWSRAIRLFAGEEATLWPSLARDLPRALSRPDTRAAIREQASTLAALVPVEGFSPGAQTPHSVFPTTCARLVGIDLFDRERIPSPLGLVIGAPGAGKSVLLARLGVDLLANRPNARVRAVDYGRSLAPLVEAAQASYLKFDPNDPATINIWDSPELDRGQMPSEAQITAVVNDTLLLAKPDPHLLRRAEDLLRLIVTEVYRNALAARRSGYYMEPTLGHLIDLLRTPPINDQQIIECANELRLALEGFRHNPWVDATTAPRFRLNSNAQLEVFELDSVELLPQRLQEALATRVAHRCIVSAQTAATVGPKPQTLVIFDECGHILPKFPAISATIERLARTGRKENVTTLLASQAYEDFTGTPARPNPAGAALAATSGFKLIGRQIGDWSRLAEDARLSEIARAAVERIPSGSGPRQWLFVVGSGDDQWAEVLSVTLSPIQLWTFATNPVEREARRLVHEALGGLISNFEQLLWLAANFPNGISAEQLPLLVAKISRIQLELAAQFQNSSTEAPASYQGN